MAKKKTAKKKPTAKVRVSKKATGAARFLRELGIERSPYGMGEPPGYWEKIKEAGGDPRELDKHGTFSAQAGNVLFATEEVAKLSLSREYEWFLNTLEYVQDVVTELPRLRRVSDVGGGVGIVSLYLATRDPNCKVTVYDHAAQQLELGRKWAADLKIRNIEYVQKQYQQLATGPEKDNDFVLFLRGMDLRLPKPGTGDISLDVNGCPRSDPRLTADLLAAMTSIKRLLSRDGIGVIACSFSAWGLINLFEACRRAGLGVDWRLSHFDLQQRGEEWVAGDCYVYVRVGWPHLGTDSYEDAQGLVSSLHFPDGSKELRRDELAKCLKDFGDAKQLLHAAGKSSKGEIERLRLLKKEGRLLLVVSSASGDFAALLNSLAGLDELLDLVQVYRDDWQESGEFHVNSPLDRRICSGRE